MNWPLVLVIGVCAAGGYAGYRLVCWMYPLEDEE